MIGGGKKQNDDERIRRNKNQHQQRKLTSNCVLACQNADYGDFADDINIVAIVGGSNSTHK